VKGFRCKLRRNNSKTEYLHECQTLREGCLTNLWDFNDNVDDISVLRANR
jgi:hypothetical protein